MFIYFYTIIYGEIYIIFILNAKMFLKLFYYSCQAS